MLKIKLSASASGKLYFKFITLPAIQKNINKNPIHRHAEKSIKITKE